MTIRRPSGEKGADMIQLLCPAIVSVPFRWRIPHLGRRIVAASGNPLAVRAKSHRENPLAMPLERAQFLSAGRLPDLGRVILTARDDPLAVWRVGHSMNPAAVPFERHQFLAAGRLPDLGRAIITAGDDPLAVRRKERRIDPFAVPVEGEHILSAGRLPDLGRVITPAVRIRWLSGEKATATIGVRPPRVRSSWPLAASQTLAV